MKLLLDVGNSSLKWACSSAGELVNRGQAPHRNRDLAVALELALQDKPRPDEVRVANVAGPAAAALIRDAMAARFGIAPVFARSRDSAHGLRNGYRDPGQLGIDRWLAMSAAWQKFPGPLCVVDAGTAVTVDIIAADGRHAGGLIVPGLALMAAALRRETGDLDRAAGPDFERDLHETRLQDRYSLGLDTAGGIRLGAIRSLVALIADCLAGAGGADGGAKLVITGGDGARLAGWLGRPDAHLPDLVLAGLALDPVCYVAA
ncbi:MAG: type III pantothenate kinase [Gammaproteobacteria bacterium]|jgi:type III pantothenate kinase|nr:type III pantothenate kinase [Gammaproteobacteria bacterium]